MKDWSTFNNYETNSMHPYSLRAFQWYQEWKEKLAKKPSYLPSYINDTRVFLRNFVCTQSDHWKEDVRKVVIILKKIELNIAINQYEIQILNYHSIFLTTHFKPNDKNLAIFTIVFTHF
jgi:hypothetical protein